MSANNWRICPQCIKVDKEKPKPAYGKVPESEYLEFLQSEKNNKQEYSLREDYEIGIDKDGEFYINYSASCQKCGFEFSYEHNEIIVKES